MKKHKYKIARGYAYLTIARCVHCGLERQRVAKGLNGNPNLYLYNPFNDKKSRTEPNCLSDDSATSATRLANKTSTNP